MTEAEIRILLDSGVLMDYLLFAQLGKGWPIWPGESDRPLHWRTNQGFLAYAQLVALSEGIYRGE